MCLHSDKYFFLMTLCPVIHQTTPRTVRGSSPHAKSLFNTSLSASVLSTSNTPMSGGHYMEDEPTEDDSVKVQLILVVIYM